MENKPTPLNEFFLRKISPDKNNPKFLSALNIKSSLNKYISLAKII